MPAKVRKSKSPARKVVKRKSSKSPARKRKTATKKRVSGYIKFLKAYKKCYPDRKASAADLAKKWSKLSEEKKKMFRGATYAEACALIEKLVTVRHRSRAVAKKRKASKSKSRKSSKSRKGGKKRRANKYLLLWLQAARKFGYMKKTKDGKFKKLPKRTAKKSSPEGKAYTAIKNEYLRLKKQHKLA